MPSSARWSRVQPSHLTDSGNQRMDVHAQNKATVAAFRAAMYDWTPEGVLASLADSFAADAVVHLAFPFEDLEGAAGWYGDALAPLAQAWPDIERRDTIIAAGTTEAGHDWVGCCGYYTGTFASDWLGIPATHRQASMRFHEFFRMVDGHVAEVQALWDIPEVMMLANAWPMGPSLGREWQIPSPATQDGLHRDWDPDRSDKSLAIVRAMGADMGRHPAEPVAAMNLETYWHPKCSWYGPAGIGTARGIEGFRTVHQIPFLKALPDRSGGGGDLGEAHFWADGDYVAVTGWPDMSMTVTGDGWLGIAPPNKRITMRSLDFWRGEGDLIRENWVLVDLLHVWDQLGVDVFARMHELPPRGN